MNKKKGLIIYQIAIGIFKSIYFNFKYLPLEQAIKLPILLSCYCTVLEAKGSVEIDSEIITTGMILIGVGTTGIIDGRANRSIIELGCESTTIFKGKAKFGNGVKVSSSGELVFGKDFSLTGDSIILCKKKIIFGDSCLISWKTQFMDSDMHKIIKNNVVINENQSIEVGNHVWIGCNTSIYKGVRIADNNIISAESSIRKSILASNTVCGGNNHKVYKTNIEWSK